MLSSPEMKNDELKLMADSIRNSLAGLRAERDELTDRTEELNKRILQLEQVLNSLAPLVEEIRLEIADNMFVEGISDLGLADACREVLKKSNTFRTARGIRDSLEHSGYDLSQHNNALAGIHGVLKRLAESGEVEQLENEGKTRYRWKSKPATVTRGSGSGGSMTVAERAITKAVEEIMNEPTALRNAIEAEAKRKG